MTIVNVHTDNDSRFIDRITSKTKTPTGRHLFGAACSSWASSTIHARPGNAQTNDMVERFNPSPVQPLK